MYNSKKNIRRISSIIFSYVLICCLLGTNTFASDTSGIANNFIEKSSTSDDLNTSKDNSTYTIGEIQDLLLDYFAANDIGLEIGTEEFYDYILNQLLYDSDQLLAQQTHYDLIHAYLAEYKINYENYIFSLESENSNLPIHSTADSALTDIDDTEPPFYEDNDFLNTTIGDIIDRNNTQEESRQELLTATLSSLSSYSSSAAVDYAKLWGGSSANEIYNDDYPYYSDADCTNFVSQCLYAGGISMVGTNASIGVYSSTSNWYCKYIESWHTHYALTGYAVTTSWINVSDFNTYLTTLAKSKTTKTTHSALIKSCAAGDVVQLADKTTGTPTHTIIISSRTSSSAKYCGHSNSRTDESITNISTSQNSFILFDLT